MRPHKPPAYPTDWNLESFQPEVDRPLPIDPNAISEHLVDLARHFRSLLPGSERVEEGTLEVIGERPVDAGGVADVWVGRMGNRKIAIKAYRYNSSSNYLSTFVVSSAYLRRVIYSLRAYWQRFYKEALTCSRLKGQSTVPFIGVYTTPKRPLTLVFEFMDHLNLREYLRKNDDAGRSELVRFCCHIRCSSYQHLRSQCQLLEIARGVKSVHELNIIHRNLKIVRSPTPRAGRALTFIQTNILIDSGGHARIAGLGAALLPPAASGVDIDRFFHGAAPELVDPQRFRLPNTEPTTASDVYAFGVLAWEVSGGQFFP